MDGTITVALDGSHAHYEEDLAGVTPANSLDFVGPELSIARLRAANRILVQIEQRGCGCSRCSLHRNAAVAARRLLTAVL